MILKNYLSNSLCNFLIKIESTWRREIKVTTPQVTLLYYGRTARSIHRRCTIKKLLLKISQYPQEKPVLQSLFEKVAGLKACICITKRPQRRSVNIAKFLRLAIPRLKNIFQRLLFDCFNSSLLHGTEGSKSKLYEDVWLQGLSHRSSFLFLSRHLSS